MTSRMLLEFVDRIEAKIRTEIIMTFQFWENVLLSNSRVVILVRSGVQKKTPDAQLGHS